MNQLLSDEQLAFEHWSLKLDLDLSQTGTAPHSGYISRVTDFAWQAWRARAAQPVSEQPAEPVAGPLRISIDQLVNRFLGWLLPKTFAPDAGISFVPPKHPHGWPIGTNLLTAVEAKEMFGYCLAGSAQPVSEQPAEQISNVQLVNKQNSILLTALQDLCENETYKSEYDGRMYRCCISCDAIISDGDPHYHYCALVKAKALIDAFAPKGEIK